MRLFLAFAIAFLLHLPLAHAQDHMVVKESPYSVGETLDRLSDILEQKDLTIFVRIDHAEGAEVVDLKMKPSQVLIFGNPKMGTPLMNAAPTIGIDLPIKVLAWEDTDGKVKLGYIKPDVIKERYGVQGQDEIFKKMAGALDNLTNAAIKK